MDSQAKYASISRGDGDIYLRLPVSKSYEEKIWVCTLRTPVPDACALTALLDQDHASGVVLVTEAGGIVTDADGKPLDFSLGRTLKANSYVCLISWGSFSSVAVWSTEIDAVESLLQVKISIPESSRRSHKLA
jgi:3'(2'), 5'-bisphosphate nucleotidase